MTKIEIQNSLKARLDKLSIIAAVTGIPEERLRELANGVKMTDAEHIILETNS